MLHPSGLYIKFWNSLLEGNLKYPADFVRLVVVVFILVIPPRKGIPNPALKTVWATPTNWPSKSEPGFAGFTTLYWVDEGSTVVPFKKLYTANRPLVEIESVSDTAGAACACIEGLNIIEPRPTGGTTTGDNNLFELVP